MFKFIYYLLFYIKFHIFTFYLYFFPRQKKYTVSDKYNDFFLLKKQKLLESLKNPIKMNTNISDLFYNINELNQYVNTNPNFEKIWKQRICMIYTPNGNIYMYYDIYKMAFVYYADLVMNNNLLNGAAIEYVRKYFCLDLYVNEADIGDYKNKFLNALLKYHFDIKDICPDNNDKKTFKNNDVFLKKKTSNSNSNSNSNTNTPDKKLYYNNKFIYSGKIHSINILNKDIIYPTNFNSSYLDNISTSTVNNRMSYSDYKQTQNKIK